MSGTSAQTARIAITTSMQTSGMSFSYTQTGEFDFANSRGMITMSAPAGMTELFLPPKVYLKISGAGEGLPHGKTWFAFNGADSGFVGPFAIYGSGGDPATMLTALTAIAGSVRLVGASTVRGVPVTEYQVNIDPAKLVAKAPGPERAALAQFARSLGKGTIPVEVWVDRQNEVRQVRLSLRLPNGGLSSGNTRLTETFEFYDFGIQVRVSAPPASQIITSGSAGLGQFAVGSITEGSSSASGSASSAASLAPTPPPIVVSPLPAPTVVASPA